jgi:putative oxidoreductase
MSTTFHGYSKATDIGLLILRVGAGIMMLLGHGVGKFNSAFGGEPINFPDPLGIGSDISIYLVVFSEFFCAILLMLGVYTRLVVIPLIITMAVAVFIHQSGQPFENMEKAVMYLVIFVAFVFTGAGRYSIDGMKSRNRS